MANIFDLYVGARLRTVQVERGLSDQALSWAMGVGLGDLQRLLNGEERISPQQFFTLFQATGIPSTDLLPDGPTTMALTGQGVYIFHTPSS